MFPVPFALYRIDMATRRTAKKDVIGPSVPMKSRLEFDSGFIGGLQCETCLMQRYASGVAMTVQY